MSDIPSTTSTTPAPASATSPLSPSGADVPMAKQPAARQPSARQPGTQPGRPGALERAQGGAELQTDHGVTTISSSVVAKIAGLATQEIPGVQAMGKSLSRVLGTIKAKMPGASTSSAQGVSVEVGQTQAAVDIDIVAYYGQSIVDTAAAIRENVIERIESMTGLEVVEVNVSIDDLWIEGEHDGDQPSRVD